jgi:hypothetical protein
MPALAVRFKKRAEITSFLKPLGLDKDFAGS